MKQQWTTARSLLSTLCHEFMHHLDLTHLRVAETGPRQERDAPGHLERVLEELSQREVINTGVIATPDVRFYPVSIDRFIREILDQEFRE